RSQHDVADLAAEGRLDLLELGDGKLEVEERATPVERSIEARGRRVEQTRGVALLLVARSGLPRFEPTVGAVRQQLGQPRESSQAPNESLRGADRGRGSGHGGRGWLEYGWRVVPVAPQVLDHVAHRYAVGERVMHADDDEQPRGIVCPPCNVGVPDAALDRQRLA